RRTRICPRHPVLLRLDRQRGAAIRLLNQNLLHLVLKCQMSTKHSRAVHAWQALFHAPEGPRKTTTKTADWRLVSDASTYAPPTIHRFVHSFRGRRTVLANVADLRQRLPAWRGTRPVLPARLAT